MIQIDEVLKHPVSHQNILIWVLLKI